MKQIVCGLLLALFVFHDASLAAENDVRALNAQVALIMKVLKENYGKTFCASSDTKVSTILDSLKHEVNSNPKYKDGMGEEEMRYELSRKFPCPHTKSK